MNDVNPILFPCLTGIGSALFPQTRNDAMTHWLKRQIGGNRYEFRNAARDEFRPLFLIDRTGAYRQFSVVGDHSRLAKAMARWIWDFSTGECELGVPERLTCSEIQSKLKSVDWDRHFTKAAKFQRFLKSVPSSTIFDESNFRGFWDQDCPVIDEAQWLAQYP